MTVVKSILVLVLLTGWAHWCMCYWSLVALCKSSSTATYNDGCSCSGCYGCTSGNFLISVVARVAVLSVASIYQKHNDFMLLTWLKLIQAYGIEIKQLMLTKNDARSDQVVRLTGYCQSFDLEQFSIRPQLIFVFLFVSGGIRYFDPADVRSCSFGCYSSSWSINASKLFIMAHAWTPPYSEISDYTLNNWITFCVAQLCTVPVIILVRSHQLVDWQCGAIIVLITVVVKNNYWATVVCQVRRVVWKLNLNSPFSELFIWMILVCLIQS